MSSALFNNYITLKLRKPVYYRAPLQQLLDGNMGTGKDFHKPIYKGILKQAKDIKQFLYTHSLIFEIKAAALKTHADF